MNKVIEIRKAIQSAIKEAHPNVHFENAPDDAAYPYIVYNLPDSLNNGTLENFVLEVDGWDHPDNGDSTALEMMMDTVDKAMNRKTFVIAPDLFFTIYRDSRETITEKDKRLKHRRYTYQARTYGE
ncbi:hypothetical protein EDD68_107105 [Melghiribacillus thermohalophilus]|uniref:DUF3168 domain-containing protein n=1 Tax=Melghiribacillus thermohalophilus TaxID=1324956 RepID=A0A4R3N538_9BACI|nr:hypothetical protein [Melghiribacillus thermohalophilus]TCT23391.1 hypothetical protein EDD68_107105 [Melghiribacillus thermohalophilus]